MSTILFIIFFTCVTAKETLEPEREKCIRCICNAVSACFSLTNCAKKTIDLNYWLEAGSPVVDTANDDDNIAFSKCIQNDECVLTTIDQYTKETIAFTGVKMKQVHQIFDK